MKTAVAEKHVGKLNGKAIRLDFDPAENPGEVIRTVIPFQAKSISEEERTIEFVGSTASVDRYGDSIVQAGWELGNFVKNPVVPWGHNYSQPPVAKATEVGLRDGNLFFKAKYPTIEELSSDPSNPSDYALFCDAIYNAYKGGYLRAFSVGFIPLEYDGNWDDGYVFTKCELLEVSCVTVPANPEALVLAFKEGVITERQKGIMVKQAQTLIDHLTKDTSSPINEDMSEETKAYIDEKFKAFEDVLAGLSKAVEGIVTAKAEEADPVDPPADDSEADAANPSEDTDGGTEEVATAEDVRSLVRSGLQDALGTID